MIINEHRKAIVRALIAGTDALLHGASGGAHKLAFVVDDENQWEQKQHPHANTCTVTGLYFPDKLSEMQITWSNYGPIWMGLWLDVPLVLHDGGEGVSADKGGDFHGNTLFPRWLAEVLNEVSNLGIIEDDIYDTKE